MRVVSLPAAFLLPFILVGAGVMKFTTGHVFQYLEYQTGIDILHPYVNTFVGVAEIVAGLLLRFRRTRRPGSLLAVGITGGAVAAHLTPWLGISPPVGLVDGAAAPWTAADFTTETSPALFATAIVSLALALVVARAESRSQQQRPAPEATPDQTFNPETQPQPV